MGKVINPIISWAREELRLLSADSWADGAYAGPAPCTLADPRCQATLARLAEVGERMKRMRSRVLDGRTFTSAAATDVRATILRAMAAKSQPVREVRRRA